MLAGLALCASAAQSLAAASEPETDYALEPSGVTVAEFRNAGTAAFAGFERGFAALLVDDLSKVPGIELIERDPLVRARGAAGAMHGEVGPRVARIVTGRIADIPGPDGNTTITVEWAVADGVTGDVVATGRLAGPAGRWIDLQKSTALGVLQAMGWDRSALEANGAWSRIVAPAAGPTDTLAASAARVW